MVLCLWAERLSKDDVDRLAVAAAGANRLERGQRVGRGLLLADCAPQRVLSQRVAAVELPDPVKFVVVGPLPLGPALARPPRPGDGAYLKRPELVEREAPLRIALDDLLDAGQLGLALRVVGLLPSAGPLESDVMCPQNLAQPLRADPDRPLGAVAQIRGQLAQAPTRERQPQRLRARRRRLDDEVLVVSRDPAGTATRPLRVQRSHPQLVEPMDHLAHSVLRRRRQPRDRRHRVAARGRQHHQRPPPPHNRPV